MIAPAIGRKAELHCHLDGIADPAMLRAFATRGEDWERAARRLEQVYPITSVAQWAREYESVLSELSSPITERLRLIAKAQLDRWRGQGVVYAEFFVSRVLGAISDEESLHEWFRALATDASSPDLELGIVVCVSRIRLARHTARIVRLARAGLIHGVALAGDEHACSIRELRAELDHIRETGIGIEIHVGETGGPDWVRDALDHGRPQRIGHGIRAFEDAPLVERIAKECVHLEFCPTSNLRLGVIKTIDELPVDRALRAGIEFSINTDDPGVFECSLTSELALVQEAFLLSAADIHRIFENTLRAAFRRRNK
jgi:adenosine deaminase